MHAYFWLAAVAVVLSQALAVPGSTTDAAKKEQLAFEKRHSHPDYGTQTRIVEYVVARADLLRRLLRQADERMRRMQWSWVELSIYGLVAPMLTLLLFFPTLLPGPLQNTVKLFNEIRCMYLPVPLPIFLTQTAWIAIILLTRDMFFLYDGDNLFDGLMKNPSLAMLFIAAASWLLITPEEVNDHSAQSRIRFSSVAGTFVISGCLINDAVSLLVEDQMTQLSIVAALTVAYGGAGVLASFTTHLPASFHQLYVIANCAAVATFYFTRLHGQTALLLLALIYAWDLATVLIEFWLQRRRLLQISDQAERTDALLDSLEEGLDRWPISAAVDALCDVVHIDMSPRRKHRTLRICLRIIAMHRTTPFSDRTVTNTCFCLDAAVSRDNAGVMNRIVYEEFVDDEHALPFILDALQSTRDAEERRIVVSLAATIFEIAPASLRVSMVVRHYPRLADAFAVCLGEREECNYDFLTKHAYSGILATTPTILDKLMAIVNGAPDAVDEGVHALSCAALARALAIQVETAPDLLEHLLGRGALMALMRAYSHGRSQALDNGARATAADILKVLAACPEWKLAVKRIADASTARNAVVRMGKGLQLRRDVPAATYNFREENY